MTDMTMTQFVTQARTRLVQTPASAAVRFETLDSWRGICAVLVAMMHFPASGALSQSAFIGNAWLFVDYFFVLSGFVIAHGYGDRIADGAGYLRYTLLRLGRIYPVHVVMLAAFVAFEGVRWALPGLLANGSAPFSGSTSWSALASNLLLLNGTGFDTMASWNNPSWSISAEFWTYLVFGACVLMLGRRFWLALLPFIVAGPIILFLFAPNLMDSTFDFGLVRCLYGFSVGAVLHRFLSASILTTNRALNSDPDGRKRIVWTALEIATIAAVTWFVALLGDTVFGIAAPMVFALAVYLFALEGGFISRLLRTRALLLLGTLSYTIYMVHIFVQGRLINVATLVERLTGIKTAGPFVLRGDDAYGFGVNGDLFGLAMVAVMIVVVIVAAWIVHMLIERPFQRWSRLLAGRIGNDGRAKDPAASDRMVNRLPAVAG